MGKTSPEPRRISRDDCTRGMNNLLYVYMLEHMEKFLILQSIGLRDHSYKK